MFLSISALFLELVFEVVPFKCPSRLFLRPICFVTKPHPDASKHAENIVLSRFEVPRPQFGYIFSNFKLFHSVLFLTEYKEKMEISFKARIENRASRRVLPPNFIPNSIFFSMTLFQLYVSIFANIIWTRHSASTTRMHYCCHFFEICFNSPQVFSRNLHPPPTFLRHVFLKWDNLWSF